MNYLTAFRHVSIGPTQLLPFAIIAGIYKVKRSSGSPELADSTVKKKPKPERCIFLFVHFAISAGNKKIFRANLITLERLLGLLGISQTGRLADRCMLAEEIIHR
jgi:hypothetical protein